MGLAASRQEAFWESCGFGHLERASFLLEEGDIDVNWVSYANDCCPIHVASQGKPEIVKLLLEHKCDVNVRDNRGNLPLHHAAMKGHSDIVQTLINAGSDVNAQEKNGWTALHNAAYWCHLDVVKILLNSGADVSIHNKDERTALHECARSQQKDDKKLGEIAHILVKAGSSINSRSSDWGEGDLTGLMYAAFHNHPDVATALIDAGCELNSVGITFWSALHWAADRGNDELVYILLEAGIDPTLRDMRGEMAVDRAKSDDIREVLQTAVDLHKEVNRIKNPVIKPASQLVKPVEPFKPKCDANFKSRSFLPQDWKPTNSVDVKNLINEKKRRLAAMTSQKYRTELARRTSTDVIKDEDVKLLDDKSREVTESDKSGKTEHSELSVSDKEENKMNESAEKVHEASSGNSESNGVTSDTVNDDLSISCSSLNLDDRHSSDIKDNDTDSAIDRSSVDADKHDSDQSDQNSVQSDNATGEALITDSDESKRQREVNSDNCNDMNKETIESPVNTETHAENSDKCNIIVSETETIPDKSVTDTNDELTENKINEQNFEHLNNGEQNPGDNDDVKSNDITTT